MTLLSFLRVSKYPPSLLFLLITLGPALIALSVLDRMTVGLRNPLLVFGRVPLFYYIVHWYVLHLTALAFAWWRYGRIDFMFGLPASLAIIPSSYPPGYGYDLWVVYLVWVGIVAALYPAVPVVRRREGAEAVGACSATFDVSRDLLLARREDTAHVFSLRRTRPATSRRRSLERSRPSPSGCRALLRKAVASPALAA